MLNSIEKIGLLQMDTENNADICIKIIFLIICDLLQKELYHVICFSALSSAGECFWNKSTFILFC